MHGRNSTLWEQILYEIFNKGTFFVMSCRFQVRSEYITQEVKANCYHLKQHHLKLKPFGVLLSMDIVVSVMTLFIETMISIGNNTVWSSVNSVGPVIFTIFISVNLWNNDFEFFALLLYACIMVLWKELGWSRLKIQMHKLFDTIVHQHRNYVVIHRKDWKYSETEPTI